MLTDAFTTLAVAGAVDDAIALAERGRAWLPTPHNPPNMTAGPTTVYLATSERETVIVSPALEGPVVLDIDRDDIMVPALSGLDVARSTMAPLRGFVPLLEVVDAITRALPEADALHPLRKHWASGRASRRASLRHWRGATVPLHWTQAAAMPTTFGQMARRGSCFW